MKSVVLFIAALILATSLFFSTRMNGASNDPEVEEMPCTVLAYRECIADSRQDGMAEADVLKNCLRQAENLKGFLGDKICEVEK